ncbi:MAG: hypothetical protein ACM3NH_04850 [Candidatus Saccharibacteria bacterium]
MPQNHEKNQESPEIAVPDGLLHKIMDRIEIERRKALARRRLGIFVAFLSLIALLSYPVWRTFQAEASYSGFFHYLSLAFSDFGLVTDYWQDYSLGLLETLPVVSTIGLLAIVFGIIALARMAVKNRRDFVRFLTNHNY